MTATEVTAANGAGAATNDAHSPLWTRVENVRGALGERTRQAGEIAGRTFDQARTRAVTTVREKPVTVSLATVGLALLAAGAVFALRNPQLLRSGLGLAGERLRRRF